MILLAVILIVDLLLIIKRPHVPSMREASLWVGFYVLLALMFAGAIYLLGDAQHATEFVAGWLTEYSLSIDNLFVFVLILGAFKVPSAYQQRALMIGIVLALIFRGIFILVGAAIIERFIAVFFIFGAWLIWTAWQQVKPAGHERSGRQLDHPPGQEGHALLRRVRRWESSARLSTASACLLRSCSCLSRSARQICCSRSTRSPRSSVSRRARSSCSPQTSSRSWVCASSTSCSAASSRSCPYLKYGIAAILAFIGVKLILHALHENELPFINGGQHVPVPEITTGMSLLFIVAAMAIATDREHRGQANRRSTRHRSRRCTSERLRSGTATARRRRSSWGYIEAGIDRNGMQC